MRILAQVDSNVLQSIKYYNAKSPLLLTDNENSVMFILDSTRTQIKAINKDGLVLWKVKPISENNLKDVVDYPQFIVDFKLVHDKKDPSKLVILIHTNSNFEGYIDKKNGKFTSFGKD